MVTAVWSRAAGHGGRRQFDVDSTLTRAPSSHTAAGSSDPCVLRLWRAVVRTRTVLRNSPANRVVPTVCIQRADPARSGPGPGMMSAPDPARLPSGVVTEIVPCCAR